jgi:hypothetical protein
MFPDDLQTPAPIPSATLWRVGLATVAGFWLGRRIPLSAAVVAGAAWLLTRQRQAVRRPSLPPAAPHPHDAPWPEAPEAEPFVPHTQAWDELREALSPVVPHPPGAAAPVQAKSQPPASPLPKTEDFAFEATEPFIIEDDDADTGKS